MTSIVYEALNTYPNSPYTNNFNFNKLLAPLGCECKSDVRYELLAVHRVRRPASPTSNGQSFARTDNKSQYLGRRYRVLLE